MALFKNFFWVISSIEDPKVDILKQYFWAIFTTIVINYDRDNQIQE